VLYALFVIYPTVQSIQLSLTNAHGIRGGPLNTLLGALGLHSLEQSWLGNPSTAL